MSEYTKRNGINYREDGYAFCDRCGSRPIVNDRCVWCDVEPTDSDTAMAEELKRWCFNPSRAHQPGFCDAKPEYFDTDLAARMLAVRRQS
jgi:hypothetical protein